MTCLRGADRRTWWRAAASVVLALVMPWAPAQAQAPAAPAFDAGRWLHRVQHAATTRSYQGTMVFSGGGIVSSSKVSHSHDGRQRLELIEVLDGQARQQFRHNDIVLTLWPRGRVAVFEPPGAVPEFPALPPVNQRLLDSYELRLIGQERMAGQETDVVMVKPRDALRFAQRYSASFGNEFVGGDDRFRTAGQCVERSVAVPVKAADKSTASSPLPLKAVICLRAYKKLEGLHDLMVLVATLDGATRGVQGRLDAQGVSLASAQRLAQHYLDGFAWNTPPTTQTPARLLP